MRGMAALIAILLVVVIGAAAYFLVLAPTDGTIDPNDPSIPPTVIVPDIQILEAANDIPANRLIRQSDYEALFQVVEVPATEVSEDDVRASEFSSVVSGKVATVDIGGGDRIKRSLFRPAGIAEQLPTPVPGQASRKAMWVYITDLGNINSSGTVDIVATYNVDTDYLRFVGSSFQDGIPVLDLVDEKISEVSTKVIAQDVPVLYIGEPTIIGPNGQPIPVSQAGAAAAGVEPTPPPLEGEQVGEPEPTQEPAAIQGAIWGVWLAVTDQEAELIDYTRRSFGSLSLIFRRADDRELVTTTGVTMDLLMRLYGVPQPYARPNVLVDLVKAPPAPQPPGQPPVVIPVPPPFGEGQAVPLPTAEPTPEPVAP